MKLGTFMMPLHPPGRSATQTLAEDREAILLADRLGWCEAFVGEHVTDLAENVTSPLMFLASLAHDTKNIVLGSGTLNLPNRHPAAIAAQVAMLDHILKGRFVMGISPGGLMSDAEVFGNHQKNRNAMFVESIDMVLKIWNSDGPLDLQGEFFKVSTVQTAIPEIGQGLILKPYQRPHPAHRRHGRGAVLPGRDREGQARLAADLGQLPVAAVGEEPLPQVRGRPAGRRRHGETRRVARRQVDLRRRRRRHRAALRQKPGGPLPLLLQATGAQAGRPLRSLAPAEGYTLLLGNSSTNAMNQTSYADRLKIVPTRDLTAVGMVGITPSILVASTSFGPTTAQELVAHAKASPGKVNYWLPGVASGPHFDMVQLEKFAGIQMTAVPFSGGAGPGLTALISGQVDIGLVNLGGALIQVKGGKLKALAVSTPQRLPELPDVPTAAEAGLGSLASPWQGLFIPAATPKPVVAKLHAALNDALSNAEVKEALGKASAVITPSKSPEEAQARVTGETARWARVITDSGVRPE